MIRDDADEIYSSSEKKRSHSKTRTHAGGQAGHVGTPRPDRGRRRTADERLHPRMDRGVEADAQSLGYPPEHDRKVNEISICPSQSLSRILDRATNDPSLYATRRFSLLACRDDGGHLCESFYMHHGRRHNALAFHSVFSTSAGAQISGVSGTLAFRRDGTGPVRMRMQ